MRLPCVRDDPTCGEKKMSVKSVTVLSACLTILSARAADPSLTIYNQGFALVRDTVPMNLETGRNDVQYSNTTAHLEPDSVILRDPAGKRSLHILEQNYRGDMVSAELLLGLYEGKELDFLVERANQPPEVVRGSTDSGTRHFSSGRLPAIRTAIPSPPIGNGLSCRRAECTHRRNQRPDSF
jgi:hypothetical protein